MKWWRWREKDVNEIRSSAADSKKRADEAERERVHAIETLVETRKINRQLRTHLEKNGWSELLQEAMRGAR